MPNFSELKTERPKQKQKLQNWQLRKIEKFNTGENGKKWKKKKESK